MTASRITEAELIEIENRLSCLTVAENLVENRKRHLDDIPYSLYQSGIDICKLRTDVRRLIAIVRES